MGPDSNTDTVAMPSTLPRPCNHLGCPATTTRGRFCDQHRREYERNRNRPTAQQRGYDRVWQRIRAQVLNEWIWCQKCGTNPAKEVHHKRPLSQGGTHDRSNLMAVCVPCHRKIDGARR